jgi:anaerobic magnesium-protoporphyrin IX monomethyl ester cyclase
VGEPVSAPADVVLVNLSNMPGVSYLAGGSMIAWSRRDARLKDVAFATVEEEVARPAGEVAELILARGPRLVGLSTYVWNIARVMQVAAALKARRPELRIVLGGGQVASAPEAILDAAPQADYVAHAEGEETLRRLVGALLLEDGPVSSVPGLAYRDGAGARRTPAAAQVDMAALPSPYQAGVLDASRRYAISIVDDSRGCPFSCKYCDWGPKNMRYAPVERLEEDFRLLAPSSELITLTGADLFMNKRWGMRVVEAFIRASAGTPARLNFPVNPLFLTPEVVSAMAAAPEKFAPSGGLQSIDAAVLKGVNRAFNKQKVEANLADLQARAPDMKSSFSLIFGLPGDDLHGFRLTLEWALRQKVKTFFIHQALVLPGAEFHREAKTLGLTYQEEPPHNVLSTDRMTREDLEAARLLAFRVGISLELPGVMDVLRPLAEARLADPLAHVALIEAWAGHLAAHGVDLTMGQPVSRIDTVYIPDRITHALGRINDEPALFAAIALLTERFAASAGAGLASAAA